MECQLSLLFHIYNFLIDPKDFESFNDARIEMFITSRKLEGLSRTRGSITHYHSGYDAISAINAFTPSSVPGTQINLGHASWHDMGSMCRVMGTSC